VQSTGISNQDLQSNQFSMIAIISHASKACLESICYILIPKNSNFLEIYEYTLAASINLTCL